MVRRAGGAMADAAMQQPAVRRRVDVVRQTYVEAKQLVEARFEGVETDFYAWVARVQAEAMKAQRQIDRARTATDYYSVLGVRPGADLPTVKAAWRERMRENHPDRFASDPDAEAAALERAQDINVAYQELTALLTGRENRARD